LLSSKEVVLSESETSWDTSFTGASAVRLAIVKLSVWHTFDVWGSICAKLILIKLKRLLRLPNKYFFVYS